MAGQDLGVERLNIMSQKEGVKRCGGRDKSILGCYTVFIVQRTTKANRPPLVLHVPAS